MIINEFVRPNTVQDAYQLLIEDSHNHILAGGAWLKLILKKADKLISLDNLNLDKIIEKDDVIEIGAMATLREIETSSIIANLCDGIFCQAINKIMGINIRNIATIGGSIMGKFAFSDIIPILLVFDAELVFYKYGVISIENFIETKNFEKDILTSIRIKKEECNGFFKKVAITPLDFAIINFAISYTNKKFNISVGSTPYIAKKAKLAMEYLNSLTIISEENIEEATQILIEELAFSNNIRGSKEYRIELTKAYIRRGLKKVINYVD